MDAPRNSSSRSASPFRQLRRWIILFVAVVLGLLAMRYSWDALADRRIAELERRAHAMGQPLLLKDFTPEVIPDADNGALPIGQALMMFRTARPSATRSPFPKFASDEDQPISSGNLPALGKLVAGFQPERSLIRSARNRPRIVWNIHHISPMYRQGLPQLTDAYGISEVLAFSADFARARSEDGEVVEDIRDLLLLQQAVDCNYQVPVTHLIATGIGARATTAVRRSAMSLQISNDAKSGATTEQVKSLIAALLDEHSLQEDGTRAFFGEAAMFVDAAPYEAHMLSPVPAWVLEPMYKADAQSRAAIDIANAQSFQQPTWSAVRAGLKPESAQDASLLESFSHPMFRSISYDPDRWPKIHFHHLAERRVAALMLALRLYQHDHGDALPQSLSELVPMYLPVVPADPFDAAGKPFRYLPLRDPPILYSVGENGADDGGSKKVMPGEKLTANGLAANRWLERDAVFSLKPVPRLLQAQDDQGQVNGGKGQKAEK